MNSPTIILFGQNLLLTTVHVYIHIYTHTNVQMYIHIHSFGEITNKILA